MAREIGPFFLNQGIKLDILTIVVLGLMVGVAGHLLNKKQKKLTITLEALTEANEAYKKLLSQKKSSEILVGLVTEQLAPLMKEFEYNTRDARFIGNPIDYVVFAENEIAIVEVKSQNSQLTAKQRKIRDLVKSGKVVWKEIRIAGKEPKQKSEDTDNNGLHKI